MKLIELLRQQRSAMAAELDVLTAPIIEEKRAFTADEETRLDKLTADLKALDARIADLVATEEATEAADKRAAEVTGGAIVKNEPRTYSKHGKNSYFLDMRNLQNGLPGSSERMQRHAKEVEVEARNSPNGFEARALSTTDGAGGNMVPPLWLEDEYIKFAREGRPFADSVVKNELPAGTDVINIPKITSGTATGAQTSGQNSAVIETDLVDSVVSSPVVTRAGQQTISLQLLEQSPVPIDKALYTDLRGALDEDIDTLTLTSPGGSGAFNGVTTLSGLNAVTYTSTTPTGPAVVQEIAMAISQARRLRKRNIDSIFMTAARWFWLSSQQDSAGRPLVVPAAQGPFNSIAGWKNLEQGDAPLQESVGTIFGVPVVIDDHIPSNLGTATNQDEIIVCRTSDLWLYESVPTFRNLPQTYGQNLSVLFQIYEYVAFLARHDKGVSVVGGTGLTAAVGY